MAVVTVTEELLRQVESYECLDVEWASAGFAIKTPDPLSMGDLLSLGGVYSKGQLYCYWPYLRDQIAKRWGSAEVGERLSRQLAEIYTRFGDAASSAGKQQVNVSLASLAGREAEFVKALVEFVGTLATEAASIPVG